MKNEKCTWVIHNFPTNLKNRFISLAKAQGLFCWEYLEYHVARILREDSKKKDDTNDSKI